MHVGKHLILDFYGCKKTLLDDYNGLLSIFEESLILCDATVLKITGKAEDPSLRIKSKYLLKCLEMVGGTKYEE